MGSYHSPRSGGSSTYDVHSDHSSPLDISSYFSDEINIAEHTAPPPVAGLSEGMVLPPVVADGSGGAGGSGGGSSNHNRNDQQYCNKQEGYRVAFRTETEVDVLDDGFKWRKYGKKSVKNSPNPRNYYRCSTEGCTVKKRVERDAADPRYVITTYDGVHNHSSPGILYYATKDDVSGRFVLAGCQVLPTTSSS